MGKFGKYLKTIVQDVDELHTDFEVTGEHDANMQIKQSFEKEILKNSEVDVAYICGNDMDHDKEAIQAMIAGKSVFVQLPVYNYEQVMKTALATKKILMLGYNRRWEDEFRRMKGYVRTIDIFPYKITMTSTDPVPAKYNTFDNKDLKFVVGQSLSHEIDLIAWTFPNSEIVFDVIEPLEKSGVYLKGRAIHSIGQVTQIEIKHQKGNLKEYTNKV